MLFTVMTLWLFVVSFIEFYKVFDHTLIDREPEPRMHSLRFINSDKRPFRCKVTTARLEYVLYVILFKLLHLANVFAFL